MAYVSGYEQDVFISYGHVDNALMNYGGRELRWVSHFKSELQKRLDQKLGRSGAAKIWMDLEELAGHLPVTSTLEEAIRSTATLVVILSQGYIASEWCNREIQGFVKAAGENGRLFVVHIEPIPLEQRPEPTRDLNGFSFFNPDLEMGLSPDELEFSQAIVRLREKLAGRLIDMGTAKHLQEQAPGAATDRPAVLLAEVTPDLAVAREELRMTIESSGCRTLPSHFYLRGAEGFQRQLDADLRESKLFVQLLGPYHSPRTEDFPEGLEGLQLERARLAGLPMLRAYMRGSVDVETMKDDWYRNFLQASDLMALDPEDLRREIEKALSRISLQMSRTTTVSEDEYPVLICASSEDQDVAFQIRDRLESQRIGWEIVEEDEPLEQVAELNNPSGLLLVSGQNADKIWIKNQLTIFRKMKINKDPAPLVCGLYFDPPEQRRRLTKSPPRFFHLIDSASEPEFHQFIEDLRGAGATA